MNRFEQVLRDEHVLISDGGMGTMIEQRGPARGLPPSASPERVLLESPETIASIHADYVAAGARAILTCTFGSSRPRLAKLGLENEFERVHRTAADVARQAAGADRIVIGSLGPLGELLSPMGKLSHEAAATLYTERVEALAASGNVDAILLETQYDLREVEAGLEAVRSSCELPVIATMSFDTHGRTMMGVSPEEMASALAAWGVEIIGANCGRSMEETLEAVRRIRTASPRAVVWAKPNAGLPRVVDGRATYDLLPEEFGRWAKRFADEGVKVFGGCCGTTPAHIEAVDEALSG